MTPLVNLFKNKKENLLCYACESPIRDQVYKTILLRDENNEPFELHLHFSTTCNNTEFIQSRLPNCKIVGHGNTFPNSRNYSGFEILKLFVYNFGV